METADTIEQLRAAMVARILPTRNGNDRWRAVKGDVVESARILPTRNGNNT